MSYTATYEPHTMNGSHGHSWQLFAKGRLVAEGWTIGKRREAELEVKTAIAARDTRRVEAA